jgi:hypothetical protein
MNRTALDRHAVPDGGDGLVDPCNMPTLVEQLK